MAVAYKGLLKGIFFSTTVLKTGANMSAGLSKSPDCLQNLSHTLLNKVGYFSPKIIAAMYRKHFFKAP